jgi:uncharacterized coiled-coil protein SlyX
MDIRDETPAERLARWTSTDAAIGHAVEAEQLHAQLAERRMEIEDLKARLAHLTSRVAQVEADNVDFRRTVGRVAPTIRARRFTRRVVRGVYRRARRVAARVLRRR